ncbi:hypothetical protein [Roseococcus pinisoli]|uniref:Uncharacterized protein n=1 Tax=Roseococcus pinisoli TaxID=2835040 RepID=A0ABS5QHA7_9PROT|nr:hypothetical protein [Roseococcus pinisoli]MBS7812317.1 hypothetical protein [Roseococcus pinisoli]
MSIMHAQPLPVESFAIEDSVGIRVGSNYWTACIYADGPGWMIEASYPAIALRGMAVVFTTEDLHLDTLHSRLAAEVDRYSDSLAAALE